jgi:hypothetical protein
MRARSPSIAACSNFLHETHTGTTGSSYRRRIRNKHVAYCGRGDPGSTITVAPFEVTFAAAFDR